MPITGDLKTMPLAELFQWAGGNRKTGVLELERNRIRRRVGFRDGRIVGCTSTDPAQLMGHSLIARGLISEQSLRYALRQQGASDAWLSDVLIEMGVVREDDVAETVAECVEEAIYGLFEWENAVFRFDVGADLGHTVEVDLKVDSVLLQGAHRHDRLEIFRGVFPSGGVVLERTDTPLPETTECGPPPPQVMTLIDGARTLAQIFLQAHAPDFGVLSILYELHRAGCFEIVEDRGRSSEVPTLLDPPVDTGPVELPAIEEFGFEAVDSEPRPEPVSESLTQPAESETVAVAEPVSETETALGGSSEVDVLIDMANNRLEGGDPDGAMAMLDACYASRPDHEALREMMSKAEAAYLHKVQQFLLPAERVPRRADSAASTDLLNPAEKSVYEQVDGTKDVQSIVWTLPQREVEVIRTLQALHEQEMILLDG